MNIKRLNEYKKASGLTNAKIAEITGITLSNIDKITSGNNTNPKLDTIQAICKAIGCTIDDIDDVQDTTKYDNSIFIKKLEYLMKKKGVANRSQLSKKSGIPYTTIVGFFEKGTENIRRTTLIKLSDFFNCSLEYLVNDEIVDENYGKNININIKSSEIQHIQKYRALDEYGKKVIDSTLDIEYERCTSIEEEEAEEIPKIKIRSSAYNKASAGTGYMLDIEEWETVEIPDTYESRQADFALTISGNSMEPVYHDGDIVLVKSQPQIEIGDIGIFIINDEGYIKKYGGDRLISLNNKYKDIKFSEGDYIKCCGKVIGRV